MPVTSNGGGTSVTGNAVLGFQALIVMQGLRTHLKFNGKFRLSRNATPSNLVRLAGQFTGKTYSNRRKGMEQALADLEALKEGRTLDGLGDLKVINDAVGGATADV